MNSRGSALMATLANYDNMSMKELLDLGEKRGIDWGDHIIYDKISVITVLKAEWQAPTFRNLTRTAISAI